MERRKARRRHDAGLSALQHERLKRALLRAGARVTELPFVHDAFDSVFVKDSVIPFTDGRRSWAVLPNPRHAERKAERSARAAALQALGYELVVTGAGPLEGGDLIARPGLPELLVGHGFRTEPRSVAALERATGLEAIPLELRDPYLYHLDTALAALEGGWVLACREAFAPGSWRRLRARVESGKLLEVPLAEARAFATNLIEVRGQAIVGSFVPRTFALLRSIGLRPVHVPLEQFQLGGGSAACLVARIQGAGPAYARDATSPTAAMRSTSEYASFSSSSPKISGSISA